MSAAEASGNQARSLSCAAELPAGVLPSAAAASEPIGSAQSVLSTALGAISSKASAAAGRVAVSGRLKFGVANIVSRRSELLLLVGISLIYSFLKGLSNAPTGYERFEKAPDDEQGHPAAKRKRENLVGIVELTSKATQRHRFQTFVRFAKPSSHIQGSDNYRINH
jgi:hypothetical protein